jgi:tripartite-type tricarboxylate transporter receptor subunit TctC
MRATRIAQLGLALAVAITFSGPRAQTTATDYPRKPIRIIVGIAPGGGLDTVTRVGARKINERWGQSVIVDNRPGGGTVIASDLASQATPDGYTLLSATDTLILNSVLKRVKYDVRKVFVPVVQMSGQMYMLLVVPSLPIKSVQDLVAYAKSKPGALNYGSAGLATTSHLGMERLSSMAGIQLTHVPYRGNAPAMMDMLAGQIQLGFSSTISSTPHVRSGRLRAIAVTGPQRAKSFPDIPTVAESGLPAYQVTNKYALFAPAGTPAPIILAINETVSRGMNQPETAKWLEADGAEAAPPATPGQFKAAFERTYDELEKQVAPMKFRLK